MNPLDQTSFSAFLALASAALFLLTTGSSICLTATTIGRKLAGAVIALLGAEFAGLAIAILTCPSPHP